MSGYTEIALLQYEIEKLRARVAELEERRCEVCGYAEHHREHTGCLRKQVSTLKAELTRVTHNLSVTEQTMREYQELAAKRLEEIAKYRDAPVVVWRTHPFDYGIVHKGVYASSHFKEQGDAWERKGWKVEHLIVKPGEEK